MDRDVEPSGLTPGPSTIYAEEVESDGIVLQTTSVSIVYTVGLSQFQLSITVLTMTNPTGAPQSIFGLGDTAIASLTVKNTGLNSVSSSVIKVQYVSSKAKGLISQ